VSFLREQVASYDAQLDDAEGRLRNFREQAQVVHLEAEATEQVRRLAEMQARRDELQAERDALARLLRRAAEPVATRSSHRLIDSWPRFPVFLGNRAIQDLLQSLTHARESTRRADGRRTDANLDVRGVDRRIMEIEGQLFLTAGSYLESLESQLGSLNANLARFGNELERIPAREVQFARLARQSGLLEEISTLLQTRLKEAEIREAVVPADVRVIDPRWSGSPRRAAPGTEPGAGRRSRADARHRRRIRQAGAGHQGQVAGGRRGASGGVPVLGLMPRIRSNGAVVQHKPGGAPAVPARLKVGRIVELADPTFEDRLVTSRDPRSPTAEAYRALRTNLTFANIERTPQVSGGDQRDARRRQEHDIVQPRDHACAARDPHIAHRCGSAHADCCTESSSGPGARTFERPAWSCDARGSGSGDRSAVRNPNALHFLPTGVLPPNPAEVIGSEKMRTLLEVYVERTTRSSSMRRR
jgi:hypothetical protein